MDQSNTCHPLHIILNQINLEKPIEELQELESFIGKT